MIFVKQGDQRPAASATLKRGEEIVDLTNATSVEFRMRPQHHGDITVRSSATIIDPVAGKVGYLWQPGDTKRSGVFYADWRVVWNDGTPETFPTIGWDVVYVASSITGT